MIYKSISVREVIAKVFRDMKPPDAYWVWDAIEWAAEAVEHIGAVGQYVRKHKLVTVTGHRAAIPCDLHRLYAVVYNDFPLRYGSQTFPYDAHCDDCLTPRVQETQPFMESYVINGAFINTSFEEGEICIIFDGVQTDVEGFPVIPDLVSYREAIYWFIRTKMIGRGYADPVFKYQDAESRWLKYCTQAENAANNYDIPRMDAFLKQTVRLIPDMTASDSLFNESSKGEYLNREGNRIYGTLI